MTKKQALTLSLIGVSVFLLPQLGFCDVEGTLQNVRDTFIGRIVPLVGALGLCYAAFCFFTGNPNAKQITWLSIIGAFVAFLAPSLITFIQSMVQ